MDAEDTDMDGSSLESADLDRPERRTGEGREPSGDRRQTAWRAATRLRKDQTRRPPAAFVVEWYLRD